MPSWKRVIVSGSDAVLNSLEVTNGITGSLHGTASWARNATTASYVLNAVSSSFASTASYINPLNQLVIITGSLIQGLEGNIATGEYSHAEGSITQATGDYSHAEGDYTQAKGNYSHAEGQETIASGSYSHAEGYQTIALANHQHVQGQFNTVSSVPAAFIVGNGTDDGNRSNLIYAHDSTVEITGSLIVPSITGSLFGTASWAQNSITSSFVTASNVFGPFGSNSVISASYALTASYLSGYVSPFPYTGSAQITGSLQVIGNTTITGSLNMSGPISNVNFIDFNTAFSATQPTAGRLSWNNSDGTLDLGMKGGNVTQQIGQEIFYEIRNDTTSSILNGTSVYASGVTVGSGRITAAPFAADGNIREVRYLGLATEDISTGVNGFVTHFGYVRGLDTRGTAPSSIAVGDENWSVGDTLYAHPTVPGKLTNIRPKHEIIVAIIIIRNQTSGVIFVRPSSFGHLDDIHDVNINTGSLSSGDLLVYDSGSDYWVNTKQLTGSYGLTGSLEATSFTGSLLGTASFATSALSSSYALTASFALNGGGGGGSNPAVTHTQLTASTTWSFNHNLNTQTPLLQVYDLGYEQIIPNEIVSIDAFTSEIRFDYTQAGYAVASSGGGLIVTGSTARLIQTVAATTWSFQHNLGTKYPGFEIFNSNDDVIIPAGIHAVDTNNAEIYFAIPSTGIAIANFSGISGSLDNAISASYAATASYSDQFNIGQTQTQYATVTSSINGSNTVFTQATGSYTSAFFKYTVTSGSNARSGEIMSVWNGTTSAFTDNSTIDIGTTTDVTSSVEISGANVQLNMQTNSSGWRIKSIATFM
jgi:hypothetical protein